MRWCIQSLIKHLPHASLGYVSVRSTLNTLKGTNTIYRLPPTKTSWESKFKGYSILTSYRRIKFGMSKNKKFFFISLSTSGPELTNKRTYVFKGWLALDEFKSEFVFHQNRLIVHIFLCFRITLKPIFCFVYMSTFIFHLEFKT